MATFSLQSQQAVQRFVLPNGLRVLHLEDHDRPLVRARLHLTIDPRDTPPGRQGLPLLLLRMLDQSETADLKPEELARILDESGIQLTQGFDQRDLSWRMVARSRDQDRAMGLLADRLLRSVFLPSMVASQRVACWQEEEGLSTAPKERMKRLLLRDPSSRPTQKSLDAITLQDLLGYRTRVLRPDRAILILHGDLGLEQAKRLVLLSLGSWMTPQPSQGAAGIPPLSESEGPVTIPEPGLGLRIQAVADRPGDLSPEVATLLGLLVPGDRGLFPMRFDLDDGRLLVTLDSPAASLGPHPMAFFLERLHVFRGRGFTQLDLDRARGAWLGRRNLESLHPETQMDSALAEALGRGVKEDRLKAVTPEMLNAGLKAWLDPAILRIGVAGDPELLKTLVKR